ncbi:hypothetical protein [Paractinoplanes atraurantiacus]|uniref:hypothetical protein n=1 Tax=Paractinoplanes atraurantiacus TaxID=1036182 RepID=UPI0015CF0867|nr:hypothetical protein [Actinoplanes atraurantiacus]
MIGRGHRGAEREDEPVVGEGLTVDVRDAVAQAGHPAPDEPDAGVLQQFGDAQLGGRAAGRGHVQAEALGEPLLGVDQRDRHVVAAAQAARQVGGRGQAGVSGTQNQDVHARET